MCICMKDSYSLYDKFVYKCVIMCKFLEIVAFPQLTSISSQDERTCVHNNGNILFEKVYPTDLSVLFVIANSIVYACD